MQDKFENLFLVSDLSRCRASHTDTGQIIRVTGFMLFLEGPEQHPGESQDAGYDTDDEYRMQLLENAEMIIKATTSIKTANCPDDKPKNLIGLLIFRMVRIGVSSLDNEESYHDDHYGNDPPQQVFLGMRVVGSQRINDKDQGNTQNGCQNILGHIEDGICSFLRFVRYLRKAADFSPLCASTT